MTADPLGTRIFDVDGTTPVKVTATLFALKADIVGVSGTAPTTAGKLDVKGADGDVFVRQTTAANLNAQVVGNVASGAADSGNPVKVAGVFNTTLPTLTTGQRGDIQVDASARQIVVGAGTAGTATGGVVTIQGVASMTDVKVAQSTAAALSGGWPVKVTDGTNTMPTMDIAARKGFMAITDGTTTAGVIVATTALKVDMASAGGTAFSTAGKIDVKGADGDVFVRQSTFANLKATITGNGSAGTADAGVVTVQGISGGTPIPVTLSGSVGSEKTNEQTFAALASAGSSTMNFTDITVSTTGKLTQLVMSSEGPCKWVMSTFDGTTATTYRTFYTEANIPFVWQPPNEDYVSQAGGTGKHFRAVVTNNNPSGVTNSVSGAVAACWLEV